MAKKTESEKSKIKKLIERSGKEGVETRRLKTELRVSRKDDGALPKVEGYAAVFNKDSEDMGFIERIAPGAFKNAIKISDARSLFNHDSNIILGRQSSGTLELKEDKNGLFASTQPPDTQLIRDMVLTPIERGDVNQQSFGFTIESDSWKGLDTDKPIRTIEKVRELFDVSVVVYPAYPDTEVGLRSLEDARKASRGIVIGEKPDEKPDPDEKDEKEEKEENITYITIIIRDKQTEKDETFDFTGESRFDEAAEKIKSLRSESKPTLTDTDDTDSRSDDHVEPDEHEERDEITTGINELIERLNK